MALVRSAAISGRAVCRRCVEVEQKISLPLGTSGADWSNTTVFPSVLLALATVPAHTHIAMKLSPQSSSEDGTRLNVFKSDYVTPGFTDLPYQH
jgi:hypothetical protein